jgi:hypothetical protein
VKQTYSKIKKNCSRRKKRKGWKKEEWMVCPSARGVLFEFDQRVQIFAQRIGIFLELTVNAGLFLSLSCSLFCSLFCSLSCSLSFPAPCSFTEGSDLPYSLWKCKRYTQYKIGLVVDFSTNAILRFIYPVLKGMIFFVLYVLYGMGKG